jgi:hypothetical protein
VLDNSIFGGCVVIVVDVCPNIYYILPKFGKTVLKFKSIENPTKYFCRILIEKIAEKPLKSQNKWKL